MFFFSEKAADLFGVYNMLSSVLVLASIQLFFFPFPKNVTTKQDQCVE